MFKKIFPILVIFSLLLSPFSVMAGFGISPPYVRSDKLTPGTHFEQKITLLRSSADEELVANVVINAPEISDWISIEGGNTFDLPKGKLQIPMIVKVDVPTDAELDVYRGYINVKISPKDDKASGVAIALGARIEIDLTVSNLTIFDFKIKKIDISDFEQLSFPWNMKIFSWFFYRLRAVMTLENLGNSKTAPSRVHVDIMDLAKRNILASIDDKSFKDVDSFTTSDIEATFPVKLEPGEYWAKIKVYKDNDIMKAEDRTFTIYPSGGMGSSAPGFGIWPWILLSFYLFILLIIFAVLVKLKSWKYILLPIYFILWIPLRFMSSFLGSSFTEAKSGFWKWMGKKASKYQDDNRKK